MQLVFVLEIVLWYYICVRGGGMGQTVQKAKLRYIDLIQFYLPLAVMSMIMMTSQSVITAALAKTSNAVIALAAYSVGQNVSRIIQAPLMAMMRLTIATADSKKSVQSLLKVARQIGAIVLAGMALIAFTPLNRIVFINIMGISEELFIPTLNVFRAYMIMPLLSIIRTPRQGFVVLRRKTIWLTFSTIIRISVMFGTAVFINSTKIVDGGVVGVVLMFVGMGTETIIAVIKGNPWLNEVGEVPPDESEPLEVSGIWKFFIPLIAAQMVMSFVNPGISASLARTVNPEVAISSFFVARSLGWIFLSVGMRIHQIVVVFVCDAQSWRTVFRFTAVIAILAVICVAMLAFTAIGPWVYATLLDVDIEIAGPALSALAFFVFVPPAFFTSELFQGLLLKSRNSQAISIIKAANVTTMFAIMLILTALFPDLGATIGVISIASSYYAEVIVAIYLARKITFHRDIDTLQELSAGAS